jgi:hypothetical protein
LPIACGALFIGAPQALAVVDGGAVCRLGLFQGYRLSISPKLVKQLAYKLGGIRGEFSLTCHNVGA